MLRERGGEVKLQDLNIYDIGNGIQIAGAVFADEGHLYLCLLPDEKAEGREVVPLDMDQDDWAKFIRQTDLLEVEILQAASDGKLEKVILRKSARQVERGVSQRVFKRDGYKCRYCGNDETPLTVDHLVCWEEGGPSTEENLVSACRRCNKTRGNLSYGDWLNHPCYLKRSRGLTERERQLNAALLPKLAGIPRNKILKSR